MSADVTLTGPAATAAPAHRVARGFPWAWMAGVSTAAAGGLHFAAAAQSVAAGNLVVGFFLVTAFAQIGVALTLGAGYWRSRVTEAPGPSTAWVAGVIAGTVALVALYVVVHSSDLLVGLTGNPAPSGAAGHVHSAAGAGHPVEITGPISPSGSPRTAGQPVSLLGTITVAIELVAIAAFAALLPATWRRRTTNGLLLLSGLAWALWLTGVLG